jgi:hypothetical protein
LKFTLALLALSSPLAAFAEDWTSYTNPRFGFSVDVPAGLEATHSDNGDGATFSDPSGVLSLSVYGANIVEGSFTDQLALSRDALAEREAEFGIEQDGGDRFVITGDAGGRRYYHYAQALCDGQQSANIWIDYAASEQARVDGWTETMVGSLKALGEPATCP